MSSTREERASHSPAPWEAHVAHDVTGYPVFYLHGFSGQRKRNMPVLEANARLIAAAPDLLAALKALLLQTNDWTVDEIRQMGMETAIEMARGAEAKAEGRS